MALIKELTRNEMKNIMAGEAVPGVEGDCQWNGCGELTIYYGCLKAKCGDWYYGSNEQTNCVKTVNSMEEGMMGACGLAYQ